MLYPSLLHESKLFALKFSGLLRHKKETTFCPILGQFLMMPFFSAKPLYNMIFKWFLKIVLKLVHLKGLTKEMTEIEFVKFGPSGPRLHAS